MKTKATYLELLKAHEKDVEVAKSSEEKLYGFISPRILHMHFVGRSVLEKHFGTERFRRLTSKDVGEQYAWLLNPVRIESVGPDSITITVGSWPQEKQKDFKVDFSLLTQSDRDFASKIRASIRLREKDRKLSALESARERMAAAENALKMAKVEYLKLKDKV